MNPEPLAIIGIGCRLPGDAVNATKLWELLASGRNAWTSVPSDRWNEEAFRHPDPNDRNGTQNHTGGHFLRQDIGVFDAHFFDILPQEAFAMDPQQRVLLETSYEALENAGIPLSQLRGSNTSVYMAMFARDYDRNLYKDTMDIPKYQATGTGEAILSNRISHVFDLRGPSMTIDTGCSGGMVAVHQACQSLRAGESDMALAGAANLILSPDHMITMSNLIMLNSEGKSYSFDDRGSGYGRGEGVATLVIKRLKDAVRANDPIRAIIVETAVNQDGHTQGITLPSSKAQAALQRKAWTNVGLDPHEVGYLEAHGTGTIAGDTKELEAIAGVFCNHRDIPLSVGSVKSNIGHLESVSGLAALIKATLILEKNLIPASVNYQSTKSKVKPDQKNIVIPTELQPLVTSGIPRVSVNSFGYGGTNAHTILEQTSSLLQKISKNSAMLEPDQRMLPSQRFCLFILSAKTPLSLNRMLGAVQAWVSDHQKEIFLSDLSYTLCTRRSIFPCRFSCIASNKEELVKALSEGANVDTASRVLPRTCMTFVFTGQGAQWPRMGCDLLASPVFRESMHRSRLILKDLGASWDLIEEVLHQERDSRLAMAELAQPITTAIQIALVDLLKSFGVIPQAVVGHSSGEISAAYCAGFLSQYAALRASYHRGFCSAISKGKGHANGAMLAVGLGEKALSSYLSKIKTGTVIVACQNSPSSTTVSGDEAAIMELMKALNRDTIFNRKLLVDTAYHSHHMQAAADKYGASLSNIETIIGETPIQLFSSVTGQRKKDNFNAEYWVTNLISRVRFCDAIQNLYGQHRETVECTKSHHIFLEVGPHNALMGPTRQCLDDVRGQQLPYSYRSALSRGIRAMQSFPAMIGKLFEDGYDVNLDALSVLWQMHEGAKVLSELPSYPWDHSKRYWHESRVSHDYRFRKHPYHDLLGIRIAESTSLEPRWRHMVGLEGLPWLADHVVDGINVFPGSGYLCMAVEAAHQLAMDSSLNTKVSRIILNNVSFLSDLVIPDSPARVELQLSFKPMQDNEDAPQCMRYSFSVAAYSRARIWHEHCRGKVLVVLGTSEPKVRPKFSSDFDLNKDLDSNSSARKTMTKDDIYQELDSQGNHYGPLFSGVDRIIMDDDFASCDVIIPDVASVMPSTYLHPHIIHPTTLDILLHSSLPLVMKKLRPGSVMPVHVEEMTLLLGIENRAGQKLSATTILGSSRLSTAEVDVMVFSDVGASHTVLSLGVTGVRLQSLAVPKIGGRKKLDNACQMCYELKWDVDVDFLTSKHLHTKDHPQSPNRQVDILNEAATIYISRCLETLRHQVSDVFDARHKSFLHWMRRYALSGNQVMARGSKTLELARLQGVEGELLTRIGSRLAPIMTANCDAIQIVLQDDLFLDAHRSIFSASCYGLLNQYIQHLCFKKSKLNAVMIRGGMSGLFSSFSKAASAKCSQQEADQCHDIAECFLQHVQEQQQDWIEAVSFTMLDLEEDPRQQGIELGSQDIVIAFDLLHLATSGLDEALAKLHSLLKENSNLLLIEVTRPQPFLNLAFGIISDWWERATESSMNGLFLSSLEWEKVFSENSISMQLHVKDHRYSPICSLLVGKTVKAVASLLYNIRLITKSDASMNLTNFSEAFTHCLSTAGYTISKSSWTDSLAGDVGINIVLDDGSNPILSSVKSETFQAISALVRRSSKILWICSGTEDGSKNPRKQLINGLARTAHAENEKLHMVVVDILPSSGDIQRPMELLMRILKTSFSGEEWTTEREYIITHDTVLIPRVLPSTKLNEAMLEQHQPSKLETQTFNKSHTPLRLEDNQEISSTQPTFVADEAHRWNLSAAEVEIVPWTVGLPFIRAQSALYEYAGYVTAVGKDVSNLKVGDKVISIDPRPCASRLHVRGAVVRHIPQGVSFSDAASCLTALMAACRSLFGIANVQRGQTVLVDGAMCYHGQAVMATAKHLKANVIGTVSSQDDANTSANASQLSTNALLVRKGARFQRALNKRLAGKNIDVVVCALNSEILREIAGFLGPSSTIVLLRRQGTAEFSTENLILPPNITISTLDIESFVWARPRDCPRLIEEAVDIMSKDATFSSPKVVVRTLKDISDYFRTQHREDYKYILNLDRDFEIKVSKPRERVLCLDPEATFVLAGGLGDLGKRLLRLMVKAGAKHLVTLSRRGRDPSTSQSLQDELDKLGGVKLHHFKCDVANIQSLRDVKSRMSSLGFKNIKGIIQSATILYDCTLENMTSDIFNSPLKAKMQGTLNMQQIFGQEDLDFFISLSSTCGIIGTGGQANYNAGNTLQDAFAQSQKGSSCHYMTLDIGTIEDADATVGDRSRIQALRRQGLTVIKSNELLNFLEFAMSSEARDTGIHQAIIGFDSRSISQTTSVNGNVKSPMFTHVRTRIGDDAGVDIHAEKRTIKKVLEELTSLESISYFIATSIGQKLSHLLEIEVSDVDLTRSVADLGLDSLIAIDLRNWILREFNAPLQSSEIIDGQTLLTLAKRVASRSPQITGTSDLLENVSSSCSRGDNSESSISATSHAVPFDAHDMEPPAQMLQPLPIPDIIDVAGQMLESHMALASVREIEEARAAIDLLQKNNGHGLDKQLENSIEFNDKRHEYYEREVYLSRREPLQDYSTFFFSHPVDGAPSHNLTERAAIITLAALDYKTGLEQGTASTSKVDEIPMCKQSQNWLFHATREPRMGLDQVVKYPSSRRVIILREGNIFKLDVPVDSTFVLLKAAFDDFLHVGQNSGPFLGALTALDRDSWASYRRALLSTPTNKATIQAIEAAAFVLCFDTTSPTTASERCNTFMTNDRTLQNRWHDKTLQFVITANGTSALLGEHSKLDGLSVGQLLEATTDAILAHNSVALAALSAPSLELPTIAFLPLDLSTSILTAISIQQQRVSDKYARIDCSELSVPALRKSALRASKLPTNATAHLAILLATTRLYTTPEPVWETVSLAFFAGGRIDWVQTYTPDAAAFFAAVRSGHQDELQPLLRAAVATHNRLIARAAAGKGSVAPLYYLLGHARAMEEAKADGPVVLPELFKTQIWRRSERHATPKRVKTDCIGGGAGFRVSEGGFLMPHPESLFVHYEVREADAYYTWQGEKEVVRKFGDELRQAVETLARIIR